MASDRLDPGVYVGVDSGGTRTNLTIEIVREEGTTIVETDETTESLSGALDLELLQGTLRAILGRLERFGGRHSLAEMPAYVWVSAAGFTPWTRKDRHVCDAAEIGDKEAQDIVKGEAEALADVTAVILRRTFTDGIPSDLQMVECGGILANDFYRTTFENQVSMRLRSDDGREVRPDLRRVKTGGAAAVRLAKDLATDLSVFDGLGEGFAPAIVDRTAARRRRPRRQQRPSR